MVFGEYYLYIDESGSSNLNHSGRYFVLSTVIIGKYDFEIIEGYLRLLKRKYLNDELKVIHMTDLFERPYSKYRKLLKPKKRINEFIKDLQSTIKTIPYLVGLYVVDKDVMRRKLSYTAGPRKRPASINLDKPYELCASEAIKDFTEFLISEKSRGEIIVESRLGEDVNFVKYFQEARKTKLRGGVINPLAKDVMQRINSLLIANKRIVNGGLEIADICSYATYRKLIGDPHRNLKVSVSFLNSISKIIRKQVYVRGKRGKLIKELNI